MGDFDSLLDFRTVFLDVWVNADGIQAMQLREDSQDQRNRLAVGGQNPADELDHRDGFAGSQGCGACANRAKFVDRIIRGERERN